MSATSLSRYPQFSKSDKEKCTYSILRHHQPKPCTFRQQKNLKPLSVIPSNLIHQALTKVRSTSKKDGVAESRYENKNLII
jgi:hypothetical protein